MIVNLNDYVSFKQQSSNKPLIDSDKENETEK